EALLINRELEKLQRNLSGISSMGRRPNAIFVLDTLKEHIAVTEARKLGIPVIAVVDTNVNPDIIDYPIPGNDDAIRANELMARVIAEAVIEGRYIAEKMTPRVAPTSTGATIPAAPVNTRTPAEQAIFEAQQEAAKAQALAEMAKRDAKVAPKSE
ncbi:MAG: 30S ribosomal protein S2, partial [Actinobacteria bacterium]|nr:30S ribosomal protein S2 [Actinomycetota bacterium]